jgi:hypothetical protein
MWEEIDKPNAAPAGRHIECQSREHLININYVVRIRGLGFFWVRIPTARGGLLVRRPRSLASKNENVNRFANDFTIALRCASPQRPHPSVKVAATQTGQD